MMKGKFMAEPIKEYYQDGKLKKGYYKTRLFRTWQHMKERCYDRKNNHYIWYGARGIAVCEEWKNNFSNFCEWAMNSGYEEHLTIDRIDLDKNYCPENCRWLDIRTQQSNRRNNRKVEYNGKTQTVAEWSRETGMNSGTILFRLNKGMKPEEVFTSEMISPKDAQLLAVESRKRNGNYHMITINGETKTLKEWAEHYHINRKTVVARIHMGWDEVEALTTPLRRKEKK